MAHQTGHKAASYGYTPSEPMKISFNTTKKKVKKKGDPQVKKKGDSQIKMERVPPSGETANLTYDVPPGEAIYDAPSAEEPLAGVGVDAAEAVATGMAPADTSAFVTGATPEDVYEEPEPEEEWEADPDDPWPVLGDYSNINEMAEYTGPPRYGEEGWVPDPGRSGSYGSPGAYNLGWPDQAEQALGEFTPEVTVLNRNPELQGYQGIPTGPPVAAYTGQDAFGYGQPWTGTETYLEPYVQNILQDVQAREAAELTGPGGVAQKSVFLNPLADLGMDAAGVTGIGGFSGVGVDPASQMAEAKYAAQMADPLGTFGGATVADIGGPAQAKITGIPAGGPGFAEISPQDAAAQFAQVQQLRGLSQIAGGELSPVIQQERERGRQDVLAMMATQRGVPTSAVMRTGMQGMADVNRQAQEAASQQQLQALQALGGAAAQVRGQDIGLAAQQAQLEQQAGLVGYEGVRQRAMQQAGFGQQANVVTAQMAQQRAMQDAGFEQQAELAKDERIQQAEQSNAELRQQSSLVNMQALNQGALQQAQQYQQAGLAKQDVSTQAALADASYQQQTNQMIFEAEQQLNLAAAQYQQTADLTNAEMEQAMTIAEAQVNAQLEGTRDQLMNAMVMQGVDRYKAEVQVNAEIQMQYNSLMKDYFAVRQGALVELGTTLMEQQWYNESSVEELRENINVIYALAGQPAPGAQQPTPALGVGGQYNIAQGIGAYPWSLQQGPWGPGLGEMVENYEGEGG